MKPEDFEAIRQNDTEFVTSEEFSKIKWIVNEHEDIYVPDYTDVLRVAFTFKFLRGRISDMVSLLSGRDFDTCEYQKAIAENSFAKLKEGILEFVCKTDFQCYLMIVKSTSISSPKSICKSAESKKVECTTRLPTMSIPSLKSTSRLRTRHPKNIWPRLRNSVQASMPFVAALIRFLWQQSWQRLFQTVGDGTL